MNETIKFLEKNGFERIGVANFANNRCNVVISQDGYAVSNNDGNTMYSNDHNIYWLIGVLTYYEYMDKNYKK
jgi:coproporphyrinogen III oxidase-like Fe-S oxidoreductase